MPDSHRPLRLFAPSIPILCLLALAGCQSAQGHAAAIPAGKEKAAQAVREIYGDAVIGEVTEPGADSGMGGLFWIVKFRRGDKDGDRQLQVTPDGIIIQLPQPMGPAELPPPVADAVAKEAGARQIVRAEKQETRATLAYAALEPPQVHYVAVLGKDGTSKRLDLSASGEVLQRRELGSEREEAPPPPPTAAEAAKDGDYPPEAAKAVAAVKRILPHVTIRGVEEVGYLDGTGAMEVLNYEVEFFQDGVQKEWNATPDGIVIEVPVPVDAAALPAAARDALANEAGWATRKLVKQETRAALKFVALERPKVIYVVELQQDGKASKLKYRPDGSRVEDIDPRALLGGGKGGSEQDPKK